jgi:hypothetical protein
MTQTTRLIVAGVLLAFAWKGNEVTIPWPQPDVAPVNAPQTSPELRAMAAPVREFLSKMTPKDRLYLSNFYDAVRYVLLRDGERDEPIIADTKKFEAFHAGSLRLAVNKSDVGKYGELGDAIDKVFLDAVGADERPVDDDLRKKLVAACGALSWAFDIHGE